jgi:16S rRNA (adenine1518-N6/adenine1519-N6)-dimethyltransferase
VTRAKRSLGQNFLADANYQRRIVEAVDPRPDDEILEIGPGTAAITQHIAGTVRRFLAIELDDALHTRLAARYADDPSVTILHRNFLEVEPAEVGPDIGAMKAFGNIPYNITSPILFKLLGRDWRPREITLMIQKEVADRILSPPGDRAYGALSVGVRTVADVERLFHVPRGAFRPAPNVDSTVIRITPRLPAELSATEETQLRTLTRVTFGWRRKQLQRILRSAGEYALNDDELESVTTEVGIDPQARPETLEPERFVRLARALHSIGRPYASADDGRTDSAGSDDDS